MGAEVVKCPACGASLKNAKQQNGVIICEYCGSLISQNNNSDRQKSEDNSFKKSLENGRVFLKAKRFYDAERIFQGVIGSDPLNCEAHSGYIRAITNDFSLFPTDVREANGLISKLSNENRLLSQVSSKDKLRNSIKTYMERLKAFYQSKLEDTNNRTVSGDLKELKSSNKDVKKLVNRNKRSNIFGLILFALIVLTAILTIVGIVRCTNNSGSTTGPFFFAAICFAVVWVVFKVSGFFGSDDDSSGRDVAVIKQDLKQSKESDLNKYHSLIQSVDSFMSEL